MRPFVAMRGLGLSWSGFARPRSGRRIRCVVLLVQGRQLLTVRSLCRTAFDAPRLQVWWAPSRRRRHEAATDANAEQYPTYDWARPTATRYTSDRVATSACCRLGRLRLPIGPDDESPARTQAVCPKEVVPPETRHWHRRADRTLPIDHFLSARRNSTRAFSTQFKTPQALLCALIFSIGT